MVANLSALRTLRDHTKPVNSVDFTKDGEWLLSSGADCRVCLYSVQTGTLDRVVTCATGGATLTRFTHDHLSVLVSSTDHTIRYTSLHDNSYLRYFKGHTDAVVGMEMSPKDDCFATASIDRTARIWDLRTTNCQGMIPLSAGRPAVSFDNQGLVLAAAVDGGSVKLFDVRGYAKGPFTTFKIDGGGAEGYGFSCVKFSNDGKLMLIGTTNARVIVLDAFEGQLRGSFTGHNNEQHLPLEASFSADAQFALSGSEDGTVHRWHIQSGQALPPLSGAHSSPVCAVKCSPTRQMVVSACSALCLWEHAPGTAG